MKKEKYNAYMKDYMQEYRRNQTDDSKAENSKRINVTVTPQEYADLQKSAKANNRSLSGEVKSLAFIALYERDNYPLDVSASLSELTRVLRGIGNNINQIARHSNSFKRVTEEKEILLQLRYLEDSVKTFSNKQQLKHEYDYQVHESKETKL